jgi:hypothetical protein
LTKGASAPFFMFDIKYCIVIDYCISGNNPVNLTDPTDNM